MAQILAQPNWTKHATEIRRIRRATRQPVDGPLHAILDKVDLDWWQLLARATPPDEAEAALLILADRSPSEATLSRAKRLADHADERVSRAARFVLGKGPSGS